MTSIIYLFIRSVLAYLVLSRYFTLGNHMRARNSYEKTVQNSEQHRLPKFSLLQGRSDPPI